MAERCTLPALSRGPSTIPTWKTFFEVNKISKGCGRTLRDLSLGMADVALSSVGSSAQDEPPPKHACSEQTEEPRMLATQASPVSPVAAKSPPALSGVCKGDASALRSHPHEAAGEEGCTQDPKASGLDVLMGAVDIELRAKRVGPAVQSAGGVRAADALGRLGGPSSTGSCTSSESAARSASGTDCRPAVLSTTWSSSSPGGSGCDGGIGGPSSENGGGHNNVDELRRDNMEAAACRTLRTLPRILLGHDAISGSAPKAGRGSRSSPLPGFSMTPDGVPDTTTPTSGASSATKATSSRRRTVDCCTPQPESSPPCVAPTTSPRHPLRPRSQRSGPGASEALAESNTVAEAVARPEATAAGSPVLDDESSPRGVELEVTTAPGGKTKTGVAARAVKAPKAVKTKAAKTKKTVAKKKVGKKRKVQSRRGPVGQSQFKGVCITPAGTWRAVIYVGRRQKYLGVFDSEFDAARAYDAAAIQHFPGKTPPLNNPDVVERQLYELSASDGKPFATAGAPELPQFPSPPGLREDFGARKRE